MEIKEIKGLYSFEINKITGTSKWYYQISDLTDFYDLNFLAKVNEKLKGSEIIFVSYPEGKTYKPFGKEEKVYYDSPIFLDDLLYFLKIDFNLNLLYIIKYDPDINLTEEIFSIEIDKVDLYNLDLGKFPLTLYGGSDKLNIYYPEELTFKLDPNEKFMYRDKDLFYFNKWNETGISAGGIIGKDYEYFEEIVIKDKKGKVISKEKGTLTEMDNGKFWKY